MSGLQLFLLAQAKKPAQLFDYDFHDRSFGPSNPGIENVLDGRSSARDAPVDWRQIVESDYREERPQWPYTSYSHIKAGKGEQVRLPSSFHISPLRAPDLHASLQMSAHRMMNTQ